MSIKSTVDAMKAEGKKWLRLAGLYESDSQLKELYRQKDFHEALNTRITAEADAIGARREVEGLNEGPIRLRRQASQVLVYGAEFPPKDLDLREAVAALVRATFFEERKNALHAMRGAKLDERQPHNQALQEIEEKIARRKAELSQ